MKNKINEENYNKLIALAKIILKEWELPTTDVSRGELIARLSQYSIEARAILRACGELGK